MSQRVFGCRKYRKLAYEARDRVLTDAEILFMQKHEAVCLACEHEMQQSAVALNLLSEAQLEPEISPNFDTRIIRRLKTEFIRSSFKYWSPAMVGAAVGALVILAAIQMIAQSSRLPSLSVPGGSEARRLATPAFPSSLQNFNFRLE